MPFDAAEIDLSKPSLVGLAIILRDKSKWPEGHVWSYVCRCTCALEIVKKKWARSVTDDEGNAARFGITIHQYDAIFFCARRHKSPIAMLEQVTPEDVANVIDKVIAGEI